MIISILTWPNDGTETIVNRAFFERQETRNERTPRAWPNSHTQHTRASHSKCSRFSQCHDQVWRSRPHCDNQWAGGFVRIYRICCVFGFRQSPNHPRLPQSGQQIERRVQGKWGILHQHTEFKPRRTLQLFRRIYRALHAGAL